MDDEIIAFDAEKAAPRGPTAAIMAFTRLELDILKALLGEGRPRKPLWGGMTTLTQYEGLYLAGPLLGAPQAVMFLEVMRRRGVDRFLSIGSCGSLTPALSLGDVFLPTGAVSEEGTSAHYPVLESEKRPDPALFSALTQALTEAGAAHAAGLVWTTDAPYRETRSRVAALAGQNVLAVDMEASALMSAARFRGLAWAGIMVASDELWGEAWRPGFASEALGNGMTRAARAALGAMLTKSS